LVRHSLSVFQKLRYSFDFSQDVAISIQSVSKLNVILVFNTFGMLMHAVVTIADMYTRLKGPRPRARRPTRLPIYPRRDRGHIPVIYCISEAVESPLIKLYESLES